jgi:phenylacetate 2-hydroxylase
MLLIVELRTEVVQNVFAANHDNSRFEKPETFDPERYLAGAKSGLQHLSYGAGSRACPGDHLANRQLYVILTRLILAFRIHEAIDPKMRPVLDPITCSSVTTGMVTQPNPFKVRFVARDEHQLSAWIQDSVQRTVVFDV